MRIFLVVMLPVFLWANSLRDAYDLLLRDQWDAADRALRVLIEQSDLATQASALRARAFLWELWGNRDSATAQILDAFDRDRDPDAFMIQFAQVLNTLRQADSIYMPRFRAILRYLEREFPAHPLRYELHAELATDMLRNSDSRRDSLLEYMDRIGVVRQWLWAGPFDNVSNAGMCEDLPPQRGFSGKEKYRGLSGIAVSWRRLDHRSPRGWILLDEIQGLTDAVNFFATNLYSPRKQDVVISLGVSGSFTLWVNGTLQVDQPSFRNLGGEGVRVRVSFRQGLNTILLKLGHESRQYSNFMLRLSDSQGLPLRLPVLLQGQPPVNSACCAGQTIEAFSWERKLQDRLKTDPEDLEALVLLAYYHVSSEDFDRARPLLLRIGARYPHSAWNMAQWADLHARSGNAVAADQELQALWLRDSTLEAAWGHRFASLIERGDLERAAKLFERRPPRMVPSSRQIFEYIKIALSLSKDSLVWAWVDTLMRNRDREAGAWIYASSVHAAIGNRKLGVELLRRRGVQLLAFPEAARELVSRYTSLGENDSAEALLQRFLKIYPHVSEVWETLAEVRFQKQEWDQVLNATRQGLAVNPWSYGLWIRRARAHEMRGETSAATDAYRQALQLPGADFSLSDRVAELQESATIQELQASWDMDSLLRESGQWSEHAEHSLILLNQRTVRIHDWGGVEQLLRLVVVVRNHRGVDAWKEFDGWNYFGGGSLEILKAVTYKANGKILEADIHQSRAVFKNLEPGDRLEVEMICRERREGSLAGEFWIEHQIAGAVPVWLSVLDVVSPRALWYREAVAGMRLNPSSADLPGNLVRRRFLAKRVPALPAEQFMPHWGDVSSRVVISSLRSWEALSVWYARLSDGKAEVSHELRAVADSLFQGTVDAAEKVRRVHDFIVRNIRYSYMPFRQSGYIPQDATKTLLTRIGDCKDMAVLAKALLKLAGVDSKLVLVNTNDEPQEPLLPMDRFNHCILWVPVRGGAFVDFTANHNGVWDLPRQDQGSMMLIVDRHRPSALGRLPFSVAQDGIERLSRDVLQGDGTLRREQLTVRRGNFAADFRDLYRDEKASRVRQLAQRGLHGVYPEAYLDTLAFDNLDSLHQELRYTMHFSARKHAMIQGPRVILPIPWADMLNAEDLPGETERNHPWILWKHWKFRGEHRQTLRIAIPEGWSAETLPRPVDIRGKNVQYRRVLRMEGDTLVAERYFAAYPAQIVPAQYAAARSEIAEILRYDQEPVLLRIRKDGED